MASASAAVVPGPERYPHHDNAAGFRVDPAWPRERIPGDAWSQMASLTIGPDGNVWTLNRGKIPVQVYSPAGALVRHWGTKDLLPNPHSIRFDPKGQLWIVDTGTHTVRRFSLDGQPLATLGTDKVRGDDATHFNEPTDVAFAKNGHVYVSDGYGNNRVAVFDPDGKLVRSWGSLGHGPGQFSLPHAIAIDREDRVYVADRNNARIQVFDLSGKPLASWDNLLTPWSVIVDGDAVWACGSSPQLWEEGRKRYPGRSPMAGIPPKDQLVLKLDREGHVKQLWVAPKGVDGQEKPGELNWVHTIAVGTDGSMYLGDIFGKRAQKFVRAGSGPSAY